MKKPRPRKPGKKRRPQPQQKPVARALPGPRRHPHADLFAGGRPTGPEMAAMAAMIGRMKR